MNKNFLIPLLEDFDNDMDIISDDDKFQEGIKSAFGSPGGKFFVAGKLIALFPEHKRYVEPFIGGGSVLFRKKKTESEYINDKDEEIYFLFKFMQDLTEQQLEALNKMEWKTTKVTFDKLLKEYKESPNHKDPIYRFYRTVYLKQTSDAGEMRSFDDRAEQRGEILKVTTRLMKIKERLSGITIENMDYKEFCKKYSNEESFTFLDPPYPSAKMNWKWCPTQEEFESFTKTIPGKWMITYEVCDGWKESKYYRKILSQYNLAAPSQGHMSRKSEMIITNYEMKQNTSFLESNIDIEDINNIIDFISSTDIVIKESDNKLYRKLKEICKLYASKRRGEDIKQDFEDLKSSFKKCISKIIEEGGTAFQLEKLDSYVMELFDKYTEYGYSVPQPDGTIREFKTLKELKDSNIDYRGYKFHIKMKEAEKKLGDFYYVRQWWKDKDNVLIENFDILTTLGIDLHLDKDILKEGFKDTTFYIELSNNTSLKMKSYESVAFMPKNSEKNKTSMPSWIKKLDSGKVSILESSELEKIIEFSGESLKKTFICSRKDENSDFWLIKEKA